MIPGLPYYHSHGLPAKGEVRILRLPRPGEDVQITITTPQESFTFSFGVDFFGDDTTSTAASLANAVNADRVSFGKSHFDSSPSKPFFAIFYGNRVSIHAAVPGPAGNTYQISAPVWCSVTQFSKGRPPFRYIQQGIEPHGRFKVLSVLPTAYLGCIGTSQEAADRFLLVFDRQIEPTPATEPLASLTLYANNPILYHFSLPLPCNTGLVVAISDNPRFYNNALPSSFNVFLGHYLA